MSAACSTQGLTQLSSKLRQFTDSLNMNLGASISRSTASSQQQTHKQHMHEQSQPQMSASHGQPPLAKDSTSSSTSSIAFKQQRETGRTAVPATCNRQQHIQQSRPSNTLVQLLQGLCLQLSRALLPTYADWLLRFWMGVLLLPGAAALHTHVLLLLRCLFSTPGLQLGPAVSLLVDGNFISPVVHLCQVRTLPVNWHEGGHGLDRKGAYEYPTAPACCISHFTLVYTDVSL